jgi:hypothetical protein
MTEDADLIAHNSQGAVAPCLSQDRAHEVPARKAEQPACPHDPIVLERSGNVLFAPEPTLPEYVDRPGGRLPKWGVSPPSNTE